MNFKPILFSTSMVQAILNGSKTQTRRVVKQQPPEGYDYLGTDTDIASGKPIFYACWEGDKYHNIKCPYGQIGDVLWVREKSMWIMLEHAHELLEGRRERTQLVYANDVHEDWVSYAKEKYNYKWKPGIHMPKDACRLFLKIKDIRVERLQDISENNAISEGVETLGLYPGYDVSNRGKFEGLWHSINGEESWSSNPWVWVIEFERIEKPENFI